MGICSTNWGGLVTHLSQTKETQSSVTKIILLIFENLVTPKSQAFFNKIATEVYLFISVVQMFISTSADHIYLWILRLADHWEMPQWG